MKALLISSLLLISFNACSGAGVVSPPVVGNTVSSGPFQTWNTDAPSVRYQQVYHFSDFITQSGTSPIWITQISFPRTSMPGGFRSQFLPNIRIDLSTTSRMPDGLSATFAQNVGADDTVCYSGSLQFMTMDVLVPIPLPTPFFYDPGAGNLLMDVRNFQTGSPPVDMMHSYIVAENTLGDSISFVSASNVNAPTGITFTAGLVTIFDVTRVPEPSTWALLAIGMGSVLHLVWHRAWAGTKSS